MKKVQKGFTLVELIVVITILAILGTIAFISLQGYSQDARDSKATSDVRSLASAIETAQMQDGASVKDYVVASTRTNNAITAPVSGTSQIAGTATLTGTVDYQVGNIDFVKLGQNGTDFKDGSNDLYAIATLISNAEDGKAYSMYQVVGQKGGKDLRKAVVKGNFIAGTDATNGIKGLVSASGASTDALADDTAFTGDLN